MFTQKDLEAKKAAGTIRDYQENYNKQPKNIYNNQRKVITTEGEKVNRAQKPNKTKDWIALQLETWCRSHGFNLVREYKVDQARRFRFDFAIPALKVAIEYEGIMNTDKSRHLTVDGYTRDAEKYNLAQMNGWIVLRYTAKNIKQVWTDLTKIRL